MDFEIFFFSKYSSHSPLQNDIFRSSTYYRFVIDNINLLRGVETFGTPFSYRRNRNHRYEGRRNRDRRISFDDLYL